MSYFPLVTGSTTLVGGYKEVADANILASSKVLVTNEGTAGTVGSLSVKITAGSSFAINSSNVLDTSTVDYLLIY